MVEPVAFDEGPVIMCNTPVAGIEQQERGFGSRRAFQSRRLARDYHRRRIAFQANPLLRDADLTQPPHLIFAEHFKAIHASAPKQSDAVEELEKRTRVSHLGNCAFWMEIGDAVNEFLSQNEIGRRYPMQK